MSERSHRYNENMRKLRKTASQVKTQEELNAKLLLVRDRTDRIDMFNAMKPYVRFENPTCPMDFYA